MHRRKQVDNVHGFWPRLTILQASAKNVEFAGLFQPEAYGLRFGAVFDRGVTLNCGFNNIFKTRRAKTI
jgi:hypothetical protein